MATSAPQTARPATDKPPRPRRWIPLSLRIFAVMLVLLGAGSAFWVGVPAYRQLAAIREIEREGGQVELRVRGPAWLRNRLGPDWSRLPDDAEGVYLSNCADDVRIMAAINRLSALRILDCGYCEVSDAALFELQAVRSLESIRISSERITDAGLPALGRLTNLRVLWLHNSRVTDDGLRHLAGLTSLTVLTLDVASITGPGLEHVKDLPNLQSLHLAVTNISDAVFPTIGEIAGLEDLDVSRTLVTDNGLRHLKRLGHLRHLRISGTQVSDSVINDLRTTAPGLWVER